MKQWDLRGVTADAGVPVAPEPPSGRTDTLRVLVDQFPAVIWTTDAHLRLTSSLGAGLATLGLGPNQLVGATLFDLLETDVPTAAPIAAHLRALAGETVSFDMPWAEQLLHCRVAPLRDADGRRIGAICVGIATTNSVDPVVADITVVMGDRVETAAPAAS